MTHIRQKHLKEQNFREIIFGFCLVGTEENAHIDHVSVISSDDVIVEAAQKHIAT